jgi:signal transduction histidine kinase
VVQRVVAADGQRYVVIGRWGPGGPPSRLFAGFYVTVLRLAAVVLMAGAVCYWLARYLTAPLRRLGASTRQLAEGDLAVRVGSAIGRRRDEIGELGRDFDFMAERVESLVSSQQRLLRDMSHELRSPLTRLNVALELAAQRAGPDAKEALERIERETGRLNELIGQLLALTRLEAGQRIAGQASIDLSALVRQVATDADFEARSLGKQVTLPHCDPCQLVGDPELLRRAIENVVRNGIRYTAEGAAVEMSLRCEASETGSRAVIRIRDHGPGVPPESLSDIFRPFYRIGDGRDRQSGGVGLGLAIAQQAIQGFGGSIAACNAPGGGLLMEILLPAQADLTGRVPSSTDA